MIILNANNDFQALKIYFEEKKIIHKRECFYLLHRTLLESDELQYHL